MKLTELIKTIQMSLKHIMNLLKSTDKEYLNWMKGKIREEHTKLPYSFLMEELQATRWLKVNFEIVNINTKIKRKRENNISIV